MAASLTVVADDYWDDGWHGPTQIRLRDGRVASCAPAGSGGHRLAGEELRMSGAIVPGIFDAHVHLGLVDGPQLHANGVSRVRDLGWDPRVAAGWLSQTARQEEALPETTRQEATLSQTARQEATLPDIEIVGAFLSCADGYPSDRVWAPATSVCVVEDPGHAAECVAQQVAVGATWIKVALNADAGPVLDGETVRSIVRAAHAAGMSVVAHAQGIGQVEKALEAGVDELAHAPWTQRLPDELVAAMAARMTWVSTFDIHGWGDYGTDFEVATDNARRFVSRGGRLRYGTDLGNGPLPLGVNERELRAMAAIGLNADQLAAAAFAPMADARPLWIPSRRPRTADEFARWVVGARPLLDSHL